VQVYRRIRQAEAAQLAGVRESVTALLDTYERFLGADMVEGLCLLREAAAREQQRRPAPDCTMSGPCSARASQHGGDDPPHRPRAGQPAAGPDLASATA
jgi:hypothetical protein